MKNAKLLALLFLVLCSCLWANSGHAETTIAPAANGKTMVISDGDVVWPPKGPGCDEFVRCCDAANKLESSAFLMCQLTVATSPDCAKGWLSIKQYLVERHVASPKECNATPAR